MFRLSHPWSQFANRTMKRELRVAAPAETPEISPIAAAINIWEALYLWMKTWFQRIKIKLRSIRMSFLFIIWTMQIEGWRRRWCCRQRWRWWKWRSLEWLWFYSTWIIWVLSDLWLKFGVICIFEVFFYMFLPFMPLCYEFYDPKFKFL